LAHFWQTDKVGIIWKVLAAEFAFTLENKRQT